ncbi:MAG: pilus assembly protein [Porphyrobacter sp.]|nr:pilus assembly protein [Porphyrobacter sp.]
MIPRLRRRLLRDSAGVTLVEFALVAPVMFVLLGALLELGYVAFARSTLESAILDASRSARVAECPGEAAALIEQEVNDRMAVVISHDGAPPEFTVRSYGDEFGNVGNPEPFNDLDASGTYGPGEPYTDINGNARWDDDMGREGNYGSFGEVVQFTATFEVASLLPFVAARINGNEGFYPIAAETVVRNEPFKDVEC